jgi:hypothetical protein
MYSVTASLYAMITDLKNLERPMTLVAYRESEDQLRRLAELRGNKSVHLRSALAQYLDKHEGKAKESAPQELR